VWYPTIQFTFKLFNPKTGEKTWRSVNVSNFVTPPPELDKRSSKADEFTITHADALGTDYPELYTITANLTQDVTISLEVRRPTGAPGFKVGKGPDGVTRTVGPDAAQPEGYVVHRFWPLTRTSGEITLNGKPLTVDGPGMFVARDTGHAAESGASRWNLPTFKARRMAVFLRSRWSSRRPMRTDAKAQVLAMSVSTLAGLSLAGNSPR